MVADSATVVPVLVKYVDTRIKIIHEPSRRLWVVIYKCEYLPICKKCTKCRESR